MWALASATHAQCLATVQPRCSFCECPSKPNHPPGTTLVCHVPDGSPQERKAGMMSIAIPRVGLLGASRHCMATCWYGPSNTGCTQTLRYWGGGRHSGASGPLYTTSGPFLFFGGGSGAFRNDCKATSDVWSEKHQAYRLMGPGGPH